MNKPFNVDGLHFVERILLATLREFLAMYNGGAQNLHIARGLAPNIPGCAELIPPLQAQRNAWRPEIRALVDGLRLVRAAMLACKLRVDWDPTQDAAEKALRLLNATARGFRPVADIIQEDFILADHVGVLFELLSNRYERTKPSTPLRITQATATQLDLPSGGES